MIALEAPPNSVKDMREITESTASLILIWKLALCIIISTDIFKKKKTSTHFS